MAKPARQKERVRCVRLRDHQIFQVPKMEESGSLTYISCMDTV